MYQTAMTNDQLMRVAPSIFATEPWEKMSDRYTFIPTIQVVERMRGEGFVPMKATQSRTRIEGKGEFTRHQIRFRDVRSGMEPVARHLGQIYSEVVLTNAHDGTSAYKVDAGLTRLVCLNGLTVNAGEHKVASFRHSGDMDGIIEASYEVIEDFPKVLEAVETFGALRLTAGQQTAFAEAAISLRYDDAAPITPTQVIRPRRSADVDPTLWNTFNTVQEHLVQGGIRGLTPGTLRRARTRAVTGISENTRLNKALWTLTEAMAKLAA
jgi:Domain of unknown function (DUF932)